MRILILEDDPFIALDLQAIVEAAGHEVAGSFASLAEIREHLAEAFDFALLDIDVVDGKSFGIASALRQRRIPFAFVSASRRHDLPADLRHASFIPKPFQEAAIRRCLPRSHPARSGC